MPEFFVEYGLIQSLPKCCNSIRRDRRFPAHWIPTLENRFHNRNPDVHAQGTGERGKPEIAGGLKMYGKHAVQADIYDSIAGMKYCREHFIKL